MLPRAAIATLLLGLAACAAPPRAAILADAAPRARWNDPSPHRVRFVSVAEGVQLEVLDWGGEGPALIFLAGLGNSAHVFDDFALALRDSFHVYGVTRRGFGASSRPKTGYDIPTLGADLRAVLDGLGLKKASLVGHSIGGEELTWTALHEPLRVEKLVYLDAAYDRAEITAASNDAPHFPAPPEPTAADRASAAAYGAYDARLSGVQTPEAEIRATYRFDAEGRFIEDGTPEEIQRAIGAASLHPEYARITAPALAVYAIFGAAEEMIPAPYWGSMSEPDRAKVRARLAHFAPLAARSRDQFRREAAHGRVVEIRGANHYVFLSHPALVLEAMRAFLAP